MHLIFSYFQKRHTSPIEFQLFKAEIQITCSLFQYFQSDRTEFAIYLTQSLPKTAFIIIPVFHIIIIRGKISISENQLFTKKAPKKASIVETWKTDSKNDHSLRLFFLYFSPFLLSFQPICDTSCLGNLS